MKRYSHRFTVNAPLERVAAFHQDGRALKLLTPPPLIVTFHQLEPLGDGSVSEFTMWFGFFPIRWKAVHSQVDPKTGFTDVQERGPFAAWTHRHTFAALDERTSEIRDEIEAQPAGLLSRVMWLALPLLFAYRAWRTRRTVEKN